MYIFDPCILILMVGFRVIQVIINNDNFFMQNSFDSGFGRITLIEGIRVKCKIQFVQTVPAFT